MQTHVQPSEKSYTGLKAVSRHHSPPQRRSEWHRLIGDLGNRFNAVVYFLIAVGSSLLASTLTPFFAVAAASSAHPHADLVVIALLHGLAFLGTGLTIGLLDSRRRRSVGVQLVKAWTVGLIAGLIVVSFVSIVLYQQIGRYILLYTWVLASTGASLYVALMWQLTGRLRPRVLLLGDGGFCVQANWFFEKEGRPLDTIVLPVSRGQEEIPWPLRSIDELSSWCQQQDVDEVIYQPSVLNKLEPIIASGLCSGLNMTAYSEYVERYYAKTVPSEIPQSWLFANSLACLRPLFLINKRSLDLLLSLTGLILASPLLAIACILVKLTDGGPIFYSQIRVGKGGKRFPIYKLRSMRVDSEKDGARWAAKNDTRVTLIGKILRKTRLDEVPQFWNILKGDMSFVGPRPERPEFVNLLNEEILHYEFRQLVKPGLTGWAQVNFPYGASVADAREKFSYDLYYIKNATITLDWQVVLKTVGAVMQGAR